MALTIPVTMTAGSMWRTANTLTLTGPDKISIGTATGALPPMSSGRTRNSRISALRKLSGCSTTSITAAMWRPRTPAMRKHATRNATHVRANMKRREDGAVREVMKRLLRSDLRFHKTDCGRFGAMTAWGLKDTSSRPAKDLGGTLRRTSKTTPRSYDSRASGDLLCSHRQGAWQM